MIKTIKIKYHSDLIDKIKYIDGKSDWIDLRVAEEYTLKKGDFVLLNLGISVQLPKGYEMIIAPRSSTFKNYGILQANGIGIIDETYCSDEDILMMPVFATRDIKIEANTRICQFRIIEHQPTIEFEEVTTLESKTRGGFGSTGCK